ncbi:hypothetical protein CN273_31080 [Bacillus thuringiensis]|nr:hypothetical protein CN273_31080 [Bacillus thuringiensis]
MDYIDTYQYTEIHANEIEIPKHCVIFLFIYLILRKIGISCEVVRFLFYLLLLKPLCSSNRSFYEKVIFQSIN